MRGGGPWDRQILYLGPCDKPVIGDSFVFPDTGEWFVYRVHPQYWTDG